MISSELFKAAELWALGGRRSVDIEINNQTNNKPKYKLWAYSYTQEEGVLVTNESELPTDEQLRKIKREKAEAILSELS